MSLIRKVIGPAALVAGLLVFMGAIGHGGAGTAFAAGGDLCQINGPYIQDINGDALGLSENKTMFAGQQALIMARTENNTNTVEEYDIDLDDEIGDSDIVVVTETDDPWQLDDEPGVDSVSGNQIIQLTNAAYLDDDVDEPSQFGDYGSFNSEIMSANTLNEDIEDILEDFEDDFGLEFLGDVCGSDTIFELLADCIDFGVWVNFNSGPFCNERAWSNLDDDEDDLDVKDIAQIIADMVADGELECDDIAQQVGREIIGLSGDDEGEIVDDVFDLCAGQAFEWDNDCFSEELLAPNAFDDDDFDIDECERIDSWWDDFSPIVVECFRPGIFEVTFFEDKDPDQALKIEITCLGDAADESGITVRPNKVEIIPAMGSVSHSLITVELLDEDGEVAAQGFEVDFSTNICSIETSGVDTFEEFDAADTIFRAYNASVASTADAVENSAAAMSAVDGTRGADTMAAADFDGDTIAAAILGCGPQDTGSAATPGTATVTARIEVLGGQDIILTATVTVVGPPADLKVSASPSTLRCGEKATITATVKDSIGQNVSEHTRVEAVTNAGGVLGGTGAVAGQAGPVVPVASTVAETFDGVATFYLLTSEQHVGPYEVVVTTGGSGSVTDDLGGVFSTRPQVAQQTVTCTLPAPASAPQPTISAPRTGTGITPPSTGDAGLLTSESSSSSWTLLAAIGVFASVIGLASVKLVRR